MRADKALEFAYNVLKNTHSSYKKDALCLLCFSESLDKSSIIAHPERDVDFEKFKSIINRRANFEPIEYITNQATFYNYDFFVSSNVLIPRVETEILVDNAIMLIDKINAKTVVDIGCGSGAISCILGKLKPNVKILAVDISSNALLIAQQNANNLNVKVNFYNGNLLEPIKNQDIDLIVSNPPYIANNYNLDKFVLHEPSLALYGGNRGDEILQDLISQFVDSKAKALVCEMGYDQKNYIQLYCDKIGLKPEFYIDLAGFDRGFYIIKD